MKHSIQTTDILVIAALFLAFAVPFLSGCESAPKARADVVKAGQYIDHLRADV